MELCLHSPVRIHDGMFKHRDHFPSCLSVHFIKFLLHVMAVIAGVMLNWRETVGRLLCCILVKYVRHSEELCGATNRILLLCGAMNCILLLCGAMNCIVLLCGATHSVPLLCGATPIFMFCAAPLSYVRRHT